MKTLGESHGGSNTWGAMEMHLAEKAPGFLEAGGVKGKGWRRRGAQPGGAGCQPPPMDYSASLLKPAVGQVVLVGKEQGLCNAAMPVNPPQCL